VANGLIKIILGEDFPKPLRKAQYSCGKNFDITILKELNDSKTDNTFLFVVIDGSELQVSFVQGDNIQHIHNVKSVIRGRTRRGGQSALRFDRLRDNSEFQFVSLSAEYINKLTGYSGIFLAGKANVKILLSEHIKGDILGIKSVSSSGKEGILESISLFKEEIISFNNKDEIETLLEFYNGVDTCDNKIVIGLDETKEYLKLGMIKTLLLSEEYYKAKRINNAEYFGTKVVKIKGFSSEGDNFIKNFGGIAGILRFNL